MNLFLIISIFFSFNCLSFFGNDYISYRDVRKKVKSLIGEGKHKEARKYFSKKVSSDDEWCVYYYNNGKCKRHQKTLSNRQLDVISKDIMCGETTSNCNQKRYQQKNISVCISNLKKYCSMTTAWDKGHPSKATKLVQRLLKLKETGGYTKSKAINSASSRCVSKLLWSFKKDIPDGDKVSFHPVSKTEYKEVKYKKYKSVYFGRYKSEKKCHIERLKLKRSGARVNNTCSKVYLGEPIKSTYYKLPIMYKDETRLYKGTVRDTHANFVSLELCNKSVKNGFTYETPLKRKVKIYKSSSDKVNSIQGSCKKKVFTVCATGDKAPRKLTSLTGN